VEEFYMGSYEHLKTINNKNFSISKKFTILLFIFGVITRLFRIGQESLWLDEALSISLAQKADIHQVIANLHYAAWDDAHPIFYYFLLHYWIEAFGTSEIALRSLSAIFGILIVLFTYYIGEKLFDKNVGIIASILLLVNPVSVWYSQEARMYTLFSLLILLSTYILFQLFLMQNIKYSVLYILTSILLIYTHYIGLLVLSLHAIFIFINILIQKNVEFLKRMVIIYVAIAILYLPWIPNMMLTISTGKAACWMTPPTLREGLGALIYVIGIIRNDPVALFGRVIPNSILSIEYMVLSLIILVILAAVILESLPKLTHFCSFTAIISIIPALIFIISIYIKPIFSIRQISSFSPELIFLIAIGLVSIRDSKYLKHLSANNIFAILLLIILLHSSISTYMIYAYETKDNWRDLADYMGNNVQCNDIILINNIFCVEPFNYYFDTYASASVYGARNINESKLRIQGYQKIWLILANPSTNNLSIITEDEFTELVTSEWHGDFEIMEKEYSKIRLISYSRIQHADIS